MNSELPTQEVVIVIIQNGDRFLFQHNPKWKDISFVGGKLETTDPTPMEAAYRECEEELGLVRGVDYILTPLEPRVYHTQKKSKRTDLLTNYVFHLFKMNLQQDIDKKINQDENIWIRKKDIENPDPSIELSEIVQIIFPQLHL